MIDGEGVVTLRKAKTIKGTFSVSPLVIITNSNLAVLEWMRDIMGFGIVYHNKKPRRQNWSSIHRYQVSNMLAASLLKELLPLLRIKRHIAEVVLETPQVPIGHTKRDPEMEAAQMEYLGRVRTLNKRGEKESASLSA